MNYKVIGPPGTGKTQTLLDKVIEYKNEGIPLDRIGYLRLHVKQLMRPETGF